MEVQREDGGMENECGRKTSSNGDYIVCCSIKLIYRSHLREDECKNAKLHKNLLSEYNYKVIIYVHTHTILVTLFQKVSLVNISHPDSNL